MHSDCHTNEPGSIVWQSEHTLICSDGTSSHCPPLRFMHIGIPRASTNRTSPIQSAPLSRVLPPPHTHIQVLHPSLGFLTQGSTYLGVPHTVHILGTPPMASQQAIPLLTPFVAKGESIHPTQP